MSQTNDEYSERKIDCRASTSSVRKEDNAYSSSSREFSNDKSSKETSYGDDMYYSTLKSKDTIAKTADQDKETYYNRIPENTRQAANTYEDQRHPEPVSPSAEIKSWKCRQCGYINSANDTSCETCQTRKPLRPCVDTRQNYGDRQLSASPVDRRTPSPDDESIYARSDPRSCARDRQRSLSNEHSQSKVECSDNEESCSASSVRSKNRHNSPQSDSSNDSRRRSLQDTTKKRYIDSYQDYSNRSDDKYSSSGNNHTKSSDNQDDQYKQSNSGLYPNLQTTSSSIAPSNDILKTSLKRQSQTHHHYDSDEENSPLESHETYSASLKNKISSHDLAYPSNQKHETSATSEKYDNFNKNLDEHSPSKGSSKRSLQPSSLTLSEDDPYRSSGENAKQMKSTENADSSKKSAGSDPIVVYVSDLPVNIDSNEILESMIQQCLESRHKQKVLGVQCDTILGIGIVYVSTDEDKHNLVKVIEKIIIEPSKNTTVSFVSELNLVSYVVIDATDTKNIPSIDDVSKRWVQLYKVKCQPQCELLSVQFPNIFRIVTHSLEELLDIRKVTEFQINKQFAMVYFCADCCFFEDLSRTTTLDRLKESIANQISDKYLSIESIHIQYNKPNANAVVLTSGRARIWKLHSSIVLDGRSIMKKDSLACRLIIRAVPKSVSTTLIKDHKMFNNTIVNILAKDDHIIIELSDKNIYDKCIDLGVVRVDEHMMRMEVYTFSSNPENSEIDAENWYATEMYSHKPDIIPFVSNPDHPIFRFKWNSKAFLEQLHRWTSNDHKKNEKGQVEFEKVCNLQRHLLRMTVMLNTIGVIKRGFYRVGEREIKLKPDRLKTILYDHKSKLQRGNTISLSRATEFPYTSTLVRVINEDCLIVYKNLVSQGYRPLLLNMANANSPGGGYKRGDGAQEETMFRRSNYFQSLDVELDDGNPTDRFYCNSNCDLEPLRKSDQMYSMDEFGAIYTSGLTVFRQPENTGYAFMEMPMYDVCAIAMAAYRDPKIENDLLASKYSVGTRKKIENIFAIAHHNKHDSLVLSALGCGAFRNPPKHVAAIFKSVIEQYAGYFKCIYFAIVDDHNTGEDLNPTGNYQPFQKILDNLQAEPKRSKLINMMIGPWRILSQTTNKEITLSDIRICYATPCYHGGRCNELKNEQHCREYSHPPLCPYADNTTPCKQKNDSQHILWFQHRQKCSYGGACELMETNYKHLNEFEHPEFCRDGGRCEDTSDEHLKSYRHVPLCKHGRDCIQIYSGSKEHCRDYRHCAPMCRFGHFCVRFHDEKHLSKESHPFQPPCSFTPFHCRQYNSFCDTKNMNSLGADIRNHCLHYSHVCRYGRQCHETSDIHWKTTIHIARNICTFGDKCRTIYDENHLNSVSHPGIADIRRLCRYQAHECRDRRNPEHIKEYRHHGNYSRSGVISCFGQNKKINFVENQDRIIQAINAYAKDTYSKSLTVPPDIIKWIKGLTPVHRCSKVIFESILVHGHVMSREHMYHLKSPKFAAQAVQEHKRVRAIFDRHKIAATENHAKEYILAIVSREYNKKYSGGETVVGDTVRPVGSDDHDCVIQIRERILQSLLKLDEIEIIKRCAIDIAEASWNLHNAPTGIKYEPDKKLETDRHIFSILGPHLGHYYGDIFLVFKSEVMQHPDTNFSPQAGTSFVSGNTFKYRPWVKDPGDEAKKIDCFHESKLHCAVPGYEYAAAAELITVTGLHKKTLDVDLQDILTRWKKVDSHQVFEAHLPQLVPLDYIEEIYIAKNLFDSLTPAAQESAKKIFRDALHITKHEINLIDTTSKGSQPSDKSRAEYQDYVAHALIEKFNKRKERAQHFRGSTVTLAPSHFSDHVALPLTIKDARTQYLRTHKNCSNSDNIFIYWETTYGDMMITLANELIDPYQSQSDIQCLVCYIAEMPSTTTSTYSEGCSYLNAGQPYRHDYIKINGTCSSSSRSFHRGSDIDNMLIYCLEIQQKTGQVTLSHAGSNSIYCQETITHKFPRNVLDLNKLQYIHVSAGSYTVPIKNLTINFEKIPDLHPSFDSKFKRGDTCIHDEKDSDTRHRSSSPQSSQSNRKKSPSLLGKAVNAVAGLFGYDLDDKNLQPCRYSINCKLQTLPRHMKEFSHPCPYSELCDNKHKEPHLTHEPHHVEQCSMKSSCQKLDDPIHRAKYRHKGYPDFLILCPEGITCRNRTVDHRIKYSHGEQVEVLFDKIETTQKSSPKDYPGEYRKSAFHEERDSDDNSRPSHPHSHQIPCRHGDDCYNEDPLHREKFSHPDNNRGRGSKQDQIPCRHGDDCYDKDPRHREKFSHPDNNRGRGSKQDQIPCRHGDDCYDKDPRHREKFSHPDNNRGRGSKQDQIPCRHGDDCYDKDPRHRAKYSHPNKK